MSERRRDAVSTLLSEHAVTISSHAVTLSAQAVSIAQYGTRLDGHDKELVSAKDNADRIEKAQSDALRSLDGKFWGIILLVLAQVAFTVWRK